MFFHAFLFKKLEFIICQETKTCIEIIFLTRYALKCEHIYNEHFFHEDLLVFCNNKQHSRISNQRKPTWWKIYIYKKQPQWSKLYIQKKQLKWSKLFEHRRQLEYTLTTPPTCHHEQLF